MLGPDGPTNPEDPEHPAHDGGTTYGFVAVQFFVLPGGQQSTSVNPQKPEQVPLPDLKTEFQKMLGNPDCNKFINDLLKLTASKEPEWNKPQGDGAMALFEKISKQGGYVLKPGLSIGGYIVGGTVEGSIAANNAVVLIRPRGYFKGTPNGFANTQAWYAITALHETLHLGGSAHFTDEALGRAAFALTGDKSELPSDKLTDIQRVLAWSSYFDRQLLNKCAPTFNGWTK